MQLPTPKQRLSSPQTSDLLFSLVVVGWDALPNLRLAYWKWCSTFSFASAKPLDWLVMLLPQTQLLKKSWARVVAGGLARFDLPSRVAGESSTTKADRFPLTYPYSLNRGCYSLLKVHKHLPCWNHLSTNLADGLSRSAAGLLEG